MTYSVASQPKDSGGMEYIILWKGSLSPIAACDQHRDAQRICDALNAALATVLPASSGPTLDWHRVEDQMPDDDMLILAYNEESEEMIIASHDDKGWWDEDNILIRKGTTHWCDPAPPEAVTDPQFNNQNSNIKN